MGGSKLKLTIFGDRVSSKCIFSVSSRVSSKIHVSHKDTRIFYSNKDTRVRGLRDTILTKSSALSQSVSLHMTKMTKSSALSLCIFNVYL